MICLAQICRSQREILAVWVYRGNGPGCPAARAVANVRDCVEELAGLDFVERHPIVKMLALGFLLLIGTTLIADGAGFDVPEGYI
jgi:hypothetical protein